jgi:hypothetical protein
LVDLDNDPDFQGKYWRRNRFGVEVFLWVAAATDLETPTYEVSKAGYVRFFKFRLQAIEERVTTRITLTSEGSYALQPWDSSDAVKAVSTIQQLDCSLLSGDCCGPRVYYRICRDEVSLLKAAPNWRLSLQGEVSRGEEGLPVEGQLELEGGFTIGSLG